MTTQKAYELWMEQKPVRSGKDFWYTIAKCIETTLELEKNKPKGKHTVLTTMENIQEHYDDLANYIRNKAIDDFAEKINEMCSKYGTGRDWHTGRPLYIHSDGTWHDLIKDVVEMMKGSAE